jgi:hypothetical protein
VEELDGVIDRVLSPTPSLLPSAEVALVRRNIVDGALGQPLFFVRRELELERVDDHTGEALLDRENILDGAVVGVGPQVVVCDCIDELSGDPQATSRSADASLQQISHSQLCGDRLHSTGRTAKHPRRGAGDDAECAHFR